MAPRYLVDTHVVIRWLAEPKRLSREQARLIQESVRKREPVAISAITLLEIALLCTDGPVHIKVSLDELFGELDTSPVFNVLPLTIEVAREVAALGKILRDPADRVIVATARVHGLRLLTSDQRIIESDVVSVVE